MIRKCPRLEDRLCWFAELNRLLLSLRMDPESCGSQEFIMAPLIGRPRCSCRWKWPLLGEANWNWLCRAHAVEFCFLYLYFTSCFFAASGQSPEAKDFVSEKEVAVQKIAEAAVENWKSISLSDCSHQAARDRLKELCASECSTNECQILQRDIQSLSCVPFDNSKGLTGCSSKDGTSCNTIQANYDRGFVSFPDAERPAEIPGEVDFSICGQRKLDATFLALRPNSSDYFFNFYFSSVDGSTRTYPGRQAPNCTLAPSQKPYDPRKRPWYKGAISIVHELVILLDCGSSMDGKVDLTRYGTRLQYAQNLTLEVLETLWTGSSVNIITFNQSSTAARDGFLTAPSKDEETILKDPEFQELAQFVNNSTAAAGGKSNISSGLALALNMFNSSVGEADNPLKIIMLLTDGNSDTSPAASMDFVRTQLKESNIKLFLYQIGTNESTPVTSLACDVGGHKEVIVVQGNELYHVRSYFSLLAQAHAASNETENGTKLAYWQGVYHDSDILGDVITVSYPAISDDELVGVAAIDIQMGGFKLEDDIATILAPLANVIFHYRPGSGDTLQCQSTPPPALACSGAGLGAVCGASSALPAADIRENHQCCKSCRGASKKREVTIIVALAVAGVVGLLVFTFLVHRAAKCCRNGTLIRPPPLSQRPHRTAGDQSSPGGESNPEKLWL